MKHAFVLLALIPTLALAERAPDKPAFGTDKKSYDALMKAEAPYIAKGRATYPAAKKRFLAGLPRGYSFEVRKRLVDPGGAAFEEVFIEVDAIKGGKVFGRIGNELGAVRSYRRGQRICFRSRRFSIGRSFIQMVAKKAIMSGNSSTHTSRDRPHDAVVFADLFSLGA